MSTVLNEVDERTNLTSSNRFELLLFRLGEAPNSDRRELFGINVFKVREIIVTPSITAIAGSSPHVMGVTNIRGQLMPVIDLASAVGCVPKNGRNILLVTEYARTTQAFAVEEVDEIVRLEWSQVLSAEGSTSASGLITSIARLDGDVHGTRLAQVLDVEQILRTVLPPPPEDTTAEAVDVRVKLRPGSIILAADDSMLARSLIQHGLTAMGAEHEMTKSGKEAWDRLEAIAKAAEAEGKTAADKVALVLTDLEMPEMDGFTLTRKIKADPRFSSIPVVGSRQASPTCRSLSLAKFMTKSQAMGSWSRSSRLTITHLMPLMTGRHAPGGVAQVAARLGAAGAEGAHHAGQPLGPVAGAEGAPILGDALDEHFFGGCWKPSVGSRRRQGALLQRTSILSYIRVGPFRRPGGLRAHRCDAEFSNKAARRVPTIVLQRLTSHVEPLSFVKRGTAAMAQIEASSPHTMNTYGRLPIALSHGEGVPSGT
jgi:two-component system chemotaxis response regulator CheV